MNEIKEIKNVNSDDINENTYLIDRNCVFKVALDCRTFKHWINDCVKEINRLNKKITELENKLHDESDDSATI